MAPSVNGLGGPLLEGGVLHGHQTAGAEATDEGGGVAKMTLRVNGIAVEPPDSFHCETAQANNPSIVGTVAIKVTPCPATAQAGWTVNTAAYPFQEGKNSVAVCANDFSTIGSPNEGCMTQSVKADNSCAESPVGGGESLTASFKGNDRQRITVGYGHSAKVAGRLTDAGGQPLGGATVCLEERTLDKERSKLLVQPLVTDSQGHYSYRLAPGPDRAVMVGYRRDARQVERHLRYLAHAHPSLHASSGRLRNGQRVHFQGRLPGPHRRGNVVILQASVLGSSRWITFRRATSRRGGIFRASYRFTSTTRATTYRFRAVVPVQDGYPWVQGHSKPVRVRVGSDEAGAADSAGASLRARLGTRPRGRRAGSLRLRECDSVLPGGGTEGATFVGPAPFTPGNNCAEPEGALIILQGGPTNSAEAHWALPMPAPPGGTMESITVTAELCDGTNHDPGTVAYAIRPAWPVDCSVKVRSFPVNSAGGSSGLLSLACNGSCAQDPFAWAHYFAATEVDPVPPGIDSLRGTLVAGGTVHGSQTLTATAHDEGGGSKACRFGSTDRWSRRERTSTARRQRQTTPASSAPSRPS